jgi:hypothetical protein
MNNERGLAENTILQWKYSGKSKTWGGAKDEMRRTKCEGRKAKDEIYKYQRRGKRNPKTKEQKVKMLPVGLWIRKSTFQTILGQF